MAGRICRPILGALLVLALWAGVATAAQPARRIVSLAPHLTELAFSVGAGDRIVATVEFSDHPDQAKRIPRIGDAFRVDFERLLALHPDVVLVWDTGTATRTIDRIRALKIPVVSIETHRLADVATALRTIGDLAGTRDVAESVASKYEADIDELRQEYRGRPPIRVFVQINERPLYTVNGRQIMSEIVSLCGGVNVFADLNELAPVVGIESVVAKNPQVILSTSDTVPDAAASWHEWRHIEAVRSGNVYTVNSDDFARSTTRLAAGARDVCRTLDTARARLTDSAKR
jgi:iron complex transport system substrate-binding protein